MLSGKPLPGMPGAQEGVVPIVRMFGVTMEGNSILAYIHGFAPYLYVPAPANFKAEHCGTFRVRSLFLRGIVHSSCELLKYPSTEAFEVIPKNDHSLTCFCYDMNLIPQSRINILFQPNTL